MYFHEIQTRENLGQRLQIPLAVLIAVAGLMGQLLQNMERGQTGSWVVAFWVAVSGCAVMLGAGFFFFVRSGWGHTYQYLPSAGEMEKYRKECTEHYADYQFCDEYVEAAMRTAIDKWLVDCATANAAINDHKSYNILWLNRVLATAAVFSFLTFVFFYFGELDKKYHEVKIVESVNLKGLDMATQKPPPPPSPPQPRQVREDRKPAPVPKPPQPLRP